MAALSCRTVDWMHRSLWVGALALAWSPVALADADRTEELVNTVCASCHTADGNSVVPTFPKLAGQRSAYLQKELSDWLAGRRQIDAMTPLREQLHERDIPGLAAHYASQQVHRGEVKDPSLLAQGRSLYLDGNEETGVPSCEACHEWEGEGNDRYPRVASQHQEYLIKELTDFRAGLRGNDPGHVMHKISRRLTDDEIRALAEYMAGLPEAAGDTP